MRLAVQVVREECFSFTPNNGEPEINIMSGALRQFLLEYGKDKVIELTFPADETLDSIVERHGLEEHRIASMTYAEAREPVIVGLFPGDCHVLIDGGHRRYYWATRGRHVLKGWAVPEIVWREFVFDPKSPFVLAHHDNGEALPHRRKG